MGIIHEKIISLKKRFIQEEGKRNLLVSQLETIEKDLESKNTYLEKCMKARSIIQIVAKQTQEKIEFHFSNIGTRAQAAVFPDPYTFKLKFEEERGKTVAYITFEKNENEGSPMIVSGGGPLDVASFALQAAVIAVGNTRKIIIADEPGRFISPNLQEKFSEMIKMVSEKLGIQYIIVTHISEIAKIADKSFIVTVQDGEAMVTS